jgi:two-component system, OmpR family, response regulator
LAPRKSPSKVCRAGQHTRSNTTRDHNGPNEPAIVATLNGCSESVWLGHPTKTVARRTIAWDVLACCPSGKERLGGLTNDGDATRLDERLLRPSSCDQAGPIGKPSTVTLDVMGQILVIEDEEEVALGIQRFLGTHGYQVVVAFDGDEGLREALRSAPDLVILDILLPSMNGFRICASLRRAEMWTPILMLTAKSGDWDQVESLEAGADDYLIKPVPMTVLLAHVRALIRRSQLFEARHLSAEGLRLDPVRGSCSSGNVVVELSGREVEVLAFLMLHRDTTVSKEELLAKVWGSDFLGNVNIVEVYVRHLRRKLESPFGRKIVETVRGRGYRLYKGERSA